MVLGALLTPSWCPLPGQAAPGQGSAVTPPMAFLARNTISPFSKDPKAQEGGTFLRLQLTTGAGRTQPKK